MSASSELKMEEKEVQVPDDNDSNIELGSLQGSDEERSDGENISISQHY